MRRSLGLWLARTIVDLTRDVEVLPAMNCREYISLERNTSSVDKER